nr:MAG TPA: Protein of unknown function (DUF983) [Caudoviricetes sp.]
MKRCLVIRKCKVCKQEYRIEEADFKQGTSAGRADVHCCSKDCIVKLERLKQKQRPSGSFRSDWNPFKD